MHVPWSTVMIDYTNHEGRRYKRHIVPRELAFEATPDFPARQWMLRAFDLYKRGPRTFAMANIHSWTPELEEK